MGTRNITRVIYGGKRVIEQYCQWDGYPTGRGSDVMRFVKRWCGSDLAKFKEKLDKCVLITSKSCKDKTYTGAPYDEELIKKMDDVFGYGCEDTKALKDGICSGVVTEDEVSRYLVMTRDTGTYILWWLMECENGITFFTDKYLESIDDKLDIQIEGLYTINVDEKWVEINFNCTKRRYSFDDVSNMDDVKILKEMKKMEEE